MKIRFFISLISILIIIFTLVIVVDILIDTPTGLNWIVWALEKRLPGQLKISKINGNLHGPFSLEDINYQYKNNIITIKKIMVDWKLLSFLKKEIAINKIEVKDVFLQGSNKEKVRLNVQGSFIKQWNLTWQIQANLTNYAVKAHGILTGELTTPSLQAQIDPLKIPELGLHLTDLKIKAQNDNGNKINWMGSVRSGKGVLSFNGYTDLIKADWPTVINLQGKDITLSNTKEYQAIASPAITLKFIDQQLNVTGNIVLPEATLNLGGSTEEADISNDIVYVDEKKPAENKDSLAVNGQLQIELGDKVRFNYQGLQTKLRGKIALVIAPNRPLVVAGRVDLIEGKYKYRNQTLNIRQGSYFLYRGGPIDDPSLNIQAVRKVTVSPQTQTATNLNPTQQPTFNAKVLGVNQATEALVGVNVRGSAKKQQLSLFSEPSGLSQTDILAYLLTGQSSSELGSSSAQLLFTALSNLSPGGGRLENLMEKTQKKIGLDEFAIGSAQQNTTVTLGKKLSKKLSVRYIAGVNQPTDTFQLNYILNKYWTVQSSTSATGSGIDLLYTIERK